MFTHDILNPKVVVAANLTMLETFKSLELNQNERASTLLLLATFLIKWYAKSNNIQEETVYNEFIKALGKCMHDSPDIRIG